jgi:putative radical SAM enzyme (TIGR03279 family)
MVTITGVEQGSRAARHGVQAGDILISINGREIRDVLDYRFHLANTTIELVLHRGAELVNVTLHKREYDDIGLDFETPLMDKKQRCENKCIFCFIDQLPGGMRETLYFKDDDSRLSFLHGNYITLTNMHERDIDRIIEMHISPVNISVHTTNPELRCFMLHNKRAGEVLSYMRRLADAGITLCGQIVLCRGINDGEELDRSLQDLKALYPAMSSVSIVPAGLTRYRDKLYELTPYTPEESARIIEQVNRVGDACEREFGKRIFCCADELYLSAGLPLPGEAYYGDYDQIENGVGMITSLVTEVATELEYADEYREKFTAPRRVSIATGVAAYDTVCKLSEQLERTFDGLEVHVYRIINHFLGETITVAGLLTGKDISEQLAGKDLGDCLLIPENALRAGEDTLLDDMTVPQLSEILGVPVFPSANDGVGFIESVLGVKLCD